MSEKPARIRIARNSLFLLVSQIASRLFTFVASIFLIRYLGASGYGAYSIVVAYVGFFAVVSDLGLGQLVVREVAYDKKRAGKYLGNFIILQLFIGFLIFLTLSFLIQFMNYPEPIVLAVYVFGFSVFITSLSAPFQSIISAFEKMHFNGLANVFSGLTTAIAILVLIYLKASLLVIMTAYSIGAVIGLLLFGLFCISRVCRPEFVLDVSLWKKLLVMAFPFALVSFLSVVYNKIDILMLSKLKNDQAVGIYNSAYRLVDIWWVIPIAINSAFYPHFSSQYKNNLVMLKRNIKRLFVVEAIVGVLLAFFIFLTAPFIVDVLFGVKFLASIDVLKLLIWYVPLHLAGGVLAMVLMAIGKTEKFTLIAAINVVLVIFLNLILIPKYSYFGSAITTIVSGFVLIILAGVFLKREKLV